MSANKPDAELDRLQNRRQYWILKTWTSSKPLPGQAPTTDAKLREVYSLYEIITITCKGGTNGSRRYRVKRGATHVGGTWTLLILSSRQLEKKKSFLVRYISNVYAFRLLEYPVISQPTPNPGEIRLNFHPPAAGSWPFGEQPPPTLVGYYHVAWHSHPSGTWLFRDSCYRSEISSFDV